ncbi:MAG: hypothetical protein HY360_21890 [Verrucomicrobia bacterium]|nr:hypothetical protein [Verrucomicrobiota bacterium]
MKSEVVSMRDVPFTRESQSLDDIARKLLVAATTATASAPNEANLRHELEKALEKACGEIGVAWSPFRLDLTLPTSDPRRKRFADVAHGAVIIEYEPPQSLSGSGKATVHAKAQAEEYARLLSAEEGRSVSDYQLVIWDGAHIAFGEVQNGGTRWSSLTGFGMAEAKRLLGALRRDGVPLVHPLLLADRAGPESPLGTELIPKLFRAVLATKHSRQTTKTKLLFFEWRRLFGQVVGIQTDSLKQLLVRQSEAHGEDYGANVAAYLFALNTFIALVAKLVAAMALKGAGEDMRDSASPIRERLQILESGELFAAAGVTNMLNGDFFAWYLDDDAWNGLASDVESLIAGLSNINFDVSKKSPDSTRDLFKGLYQSFVPHALRHALGEFYTPDWLAAHVMNEAGWQRRDSLTDPTCGTGTFLLEGLRRRLTHAPESATAEELLAGLQGMDLNPLAVLAARASLVVFLAQRLRPGQGLRLPIYLADAINPVDLVGAAFEHSLQTEKGLFRFTVPKALVVHADFFAFFTRLRELLDAGQSSAQIFSVLNKEAAAAKLSLGEQAQFQQTIDSLARLHQEGWDGIWCSILADRFAAGAMPQADFVCGNPPWVKWSHLPPDYASFIKSRCLQLGVFSEDKWVGGIESDISTVVTYVAAERWLKRGGTLAFLITGTVFANESSQGFRRFEIARLKLPMAVTRVEDFGEVAPFEGVSNHPTLLVFRTGSATRYPVTYRWWSPAGAAGHPKRSYASAEEFVLEAKKFDDFAAPVPGTDAGPWLKGTRTQHEAWQHLFAQGTHDYVARKGITTDANGIFFVRVLENDRASGLCRIENDPTLGKRADIARVNASVEAEHLFPLLRGRGVAAFKAQTDLDYGVLVPQRGMHGNPALPVDFPATFRYLKRFCRVLEQRSSLRRFQKKQAWWSLWSTGAYSFARHKVAWREMPGGRFAAAIVAPVRHPQLGTKPVVLDHKLYFVPCQSLKEAAFLTALLNAPIVSEAISAYASQLSLGVSVVEYLALPTFSPHNRTHGALASLALRLTQKSGAPSSSEWDELDALTRTAFNLP